MQPQIQYVQTSDCVSIAFYTMGEGPPLVILSSILWSHLRIRFVPEFHRDGRGVGRFNGIVRYDARGTGLSDRNVTDFSLEARVADLSTVVDHLGLDRFAVLAPAHATLGAVAYAAANPERVSKMVLYMPYVKGDEFVRRVRRYESLRESARDDFDTYTLTMANVNLGFLDPDLARRVARRYREAMTPEALLAFVDATSQIDVTGLLPQVRTETLILHQAVSSAQGPNLESARRVAAAIKGARLATVSGEQAMVMDDRLIAAVEEFLGSTPQIAAVAAGSPAAGSTARHGTAIILFADIVDSTILTERMGDAAFREKARELHATLRTVIRDGGGSLIEGKLLGDGVLATFASARQAIEAALACAAAGNPVGLPLHLGLHAGDVIREENNVYGGAVNIASRISGLSAPGEVLVSQTARDLARTSAGVAFEDRGEQALKGVGEPVRVWAVAEGELSASTSSGRTEE